MDNKDKKTIIIAAIALAITFIAIAIINNTPEQASHKGTGCDARITGQATICR